MNEKAAPSYDPFKNSECEETIHELYHFLDGELTESRRLEIKYHLDHCGPCVDMVSFESELRRVIADRCREHIPDELRKKIADLIHHEMNGGKNAD